MYLGKAGLRDTLRQYYIRFLKHPITQSSSESGSVNASVKIPEKKNIDQKL